MKKIIERQFPKDETEDDVLTDREWLWEGSSEAVEEFDREMSEWFDCEELLTLNEELQ